MLPRHCAPEAIRPCECASHQAPHIHVWPSLKQVLNNTFGALVWLPGESESIKSGLEKSFLLGENRPNSQRAILRWLSIPSAALSGRPDQTTTGRSLIMHISTHLAGGFGPSRESDLTCKKSFPHIHATRFVHAFPFLRLREVPGRFPQRGSLPSNLCQFQASPKGMKAERSFSPIVLLGSSSPSKASRGRIVPTQVAQPLSSSRPSSPIRNPTPPKDRKEMSCLLNRASFSSAPCSFC